MHTLRHFCLNKITVRLILGFKSIFQVFVVNSISDHHYWNIGIAFGITLIKPYGY